MRAEGSKVQGPWSNLIVSVTLKLAQTEISTTIEVEQMEFKTQVLIEEHSLTKKRDRTTLTNYLCV
jgi:hypothetical protein